MPLSLRLPADIESDIAAFSARHKTSKSAVIVRSIREFLAAHAQPSSQQIYTEEMQAAARRAETASISNTARIETRPHKIRFAQLMREKHARRTGQTLKASRTTPAKTGA